MIKGLSMSGVMLHKGVLVVIRDEAWWWGVGGSKEGKFSVT